MATTFLISAALIASSIYVILDINEPFTGPIQISPAPLQRALVEMQR